MARLPVSSRFLEHAVLGTVAFFLTGAFLRLFSGYTDLVSGAGDLKYQAALMLVYFAVFVIGLAHLRRTIRLGWHVPALIALLLLACGSALWAQMPGLVLRRSIGLAGATLFGLVFASCLDFEEQLTLLRRIFRVVVLLTLIAWALSPVLGTSIVSGESTVVRGYQVTIETGAWRGIFNHKNILGGMMALALLVEWHAPAHDALQKIMKGFFLSSYAALLLLSHSITALLSVGLTILLMITFKALRHKYQLIVPILLMTAICVGSVVALNASSVTGALGRSGDLSGRVDLWHWVLIMIGDKPVLGYGFSGFWRGASDQSDVVETRIGWVPEYAHNGYLEITLSLGLAGLLLFLWFAGTGMKRAATLAKRAESLPDLWPLAFLVFFLIHNLGEVSILWQNSFEWGLCVAVVVTADPWLQAQFAAVPEEPEEETKLEAEPEYS